MDTISYILKSIFTYLFYPAIVLGVFASIVLAVMSIVSEGKERGFIRRLTGALLPVILLVFVIIAIDTKDDPITQFLRWIPVFFHLIIGVVIGVAAVEISRYIDDKEDTAASIYALFLSSIGVFMLYSIMQGFLGSLNYFLFGAVVAAGLDVIFRD